MSTKCFTCGGEEDARFIDKPCPECGRTYGHKELEIVKEEPEFIKATTNLGIPNEYIGKSWTKDNIVKDKTQEATNRRFQMYVDQLNKVHGIFESGLMPTKSAIVIAPPGYSKVTWAYSCMQYALNKGFTVAPILDTIELKRLLVLASEKPFYKLYNKIDYDEYISSDICFITVTKTDFCMDAWRIIVEILDRRSRQGLSTFILSRFDIKTLSKRDFQGHFRNFIDYNGTENSLKYPAIISYVSEF